MSENYTPGQGVEPEDPLWTVLLSQRDLGLRIPINFVTHPGVSLSAACIRDGKYEDDAVADCVSNLLAIGFRRFELDLYWDQNQTSWSFCPVAIPPGIPVSGIPPSATIDGSSALRTLSSSSGSSRTSNHSQTSSNTLSISSTQTSALNVRQATLEPSSLVPSSPSRSLADSSLGISNPVASTISESPDLPIIRIGQVACSTTITLSAFVSLLFDYFQGTENTLEAHLLYVILNVHAASTFDSPNSPAPQPTILPTTPQLIGNLFSSNLSAYMYRPDELRAERLNLNSSWYTVSEANRPVNTYYTTRSNENNIVSTEDGWPSESYLEFSRSKRLLIGWGNIDPQMASYDFASEASTVFSRGSLVRRQSDLEVTENGQIQNGCFLRDGIVSVASANSSWAISDTVSNFKYPTSPGADLAPLISLAHNLTNCGISPHLNHTLLSSTAAQNSTPYLLYSNAGIWSWAPGQPTNDSTSRGSNNNDDNNDLYRCATTSVSTGLWSVSDCSTRLPAACRSVSHPYNWTVTSHDISYGSAAEACGNEYVFAAPMTALENAYLTKRIRESRRDGRVWVDFNALNIEACWVMGGPNAICPYGNGQGYDDLERRTILVPTIAAIIVLIISALTVFVKMAGNRKSRRRTRRRKRRAENGFVYEGVPS